jgi:hypothetical protein
MTVPTGVLSFVVGPFTGICYSDYPRGLPGTEARTERLKVEAESLVREKEEIEEMERDVLW